MSDLISRESLIENLNKFAPEHYNALINMLIMKEPVAYDVDKVIEELQNRAEEYLEDWSRFGNDSDFGAMNACCAAIRIVNGKRGLWHVVEELIESEGKQNE